MSDLVDKSVPGFNAAWDVVRKAFEAEKAIQKILIDLANDARKDIDFVRVDTRNYANLAVEIFLKGDGDE